MQYIFKGIKGIQWGKEVYIAQIPFDEIETIGRIDADVQREADKSRMDEIAEYILNPFKNNSVSSGFNSLVTSLRESELSYDEEKNDIRLSTRGKLYLCDGQHRFGGIIRALKKAQEELEKANNNCDVKSVSYWNNVLEKLGEMTIPVVIFTDLKLQEEKQLFHDLNKLGVSVNNTIALSRDENDMYNRIAKQLSDDIKPIRKFGINKSIKSLGESNKQIATLSTWNACIRILLNGYSDIEKQWNSAWNFDDKKNICLEFWQEVFSIMPREFTNKKKYMITKSGYFLQGIAEFGHKIISNDYINYKTKITKLKSFNWECNNSVYSKYNGWYLTKDKKSYGCNGTRSAINSIAIILEDYISSKS